jgi:protein-tyrosine-phosphatase
MTKPTVLFLCIHNAGRSQMELGFFNRLAGGEALAYSGGSQPRMWSSRRAASCDRVDARG